MGNLLVYFLRLHSNARDTIVTVVLGSWERETVARRRTISTGSWNLGIWEPRRNIQCTSTSSARPPILFEPGKSSVIGSGSNKSVVSTTSFNERRHVSEPVCLCGRHVAGSELSGRTRRRSGPHMAARMPVSFSSGDTLMSCWLSGCLAYIVADNNRLSKASARPNQTSPLLCCATLNELVPFSQPLTEASPPFLLGSSATQVVVCLSVSVSRFECVFVHLDVEGQVGRNNSGRANEFQRSRRVRGAKSECGVL